MTKLFPHDKKSNLWQGSASTIASLIKTELNQKLNDLDRTGLYVAEVKVDGHYTTIFCHSDHNEFYSRNLKSQKSPELELIRLPEGMIVAAELGCGTQNSLTEKTRLGHEFAVVYRILATPVYLRDQFPDDATLLDEVSQRCLLEIIWSGLDEFTKQRFRLVHRFSTDFVKAYQDTVDSGGEGLVIKSIDPLSDNMYKAAQYSRSWIKVKKLITVDLVIMKILISDALTFKDKNMASAIICGAYRYGILNPVCRVGTMDHSQRILFGANKQEYMGRVVEIGGFDQFQSGAIRHPWLIRIRDDKDACHCLISEASDDSQKP